MLMNDSDIDLPKALLSRYFELYTSETYTNMDTDNRGLDTIIMFDRTCGGSIMP